MYDTIKVIEDTFGGVDILINNALFGDAGILLCQLQPMSGVSLLI